jgi:prevent-host-death family protein
MIRSRPLQTVNVHAAKTHFSRLADQAAAGEEIIIAKAGKPVAKLVPLSSHMIGRARRLHLNTVVMRKRQVRSLT